MNDKEINEAVARKLGWRGTFPDQYPDYCHSITAAWEVVEQVFTSFYLSWDETTETWFAKWDNQHRTEESCRYKGEADTAPMAICLAFLKLP